MILQQHHSDVDARFSSSSSSDSDAWIEKMGKVRSPVRLPTPAYVHFPIASSSSSSTYDVYWRVATLPGVKSSLSSLPGDERWQHSSQFTGSHHTRVNPNQKKQLLILQQHHSDVDARFSSSSSSSVSETKKRKRKVRSPIRLPTPKLCTPSFSVLRVRNGPRNLSGPGPSCG